jgi:hypothetical protein
MNGCQLCESAVELFPGDKFLQGVGQNCALNLAGQLSLTFKYRQNEPWGLNLAERLAKDVDEHGGELSQSGMSEVAEA